MPFIPHTEEEVQQMLATMGMASIEALFAEIPIALRQANYPALPPGKSEMEMTRIMHARARQNKSLQCFIGAGAYEHHIPGAVWEIATRGEFMTAYTPYQPEASQGSLQLLYEYQTMMASLMGLAVSNASLYEGASALAEAILMGIRLLPAKALQNKIPTVLIPEALHPHYREVVHTIVGQRAKLVSLPYDHQRGRLNLAALAVVEEPAQLLVIAQPNFFGVLEEVDELTEWAQERAMIVIALVNPLSMALLKPPGHWGQRGVDLACGEGQPLGVPLSCGGPYYGFLCCQQPHIRQMPGRIVGRTVDQQGKEGFVLTLQAREQHIRRAKATSNICTNQGLMVTASTIYMSLLGPLGLRQVAAVAHSQAKSLADKLREIKGVELIFSAPFFHEFALRLPVSVGAVLQQMAKEGVQGGYALKERYPALGEGLLVCVTETKTAADLDHYRDCLQKAIAWVAKESKC